MKSQCKAYFSEYLYPFAFKGYRGDKEEAAEAYCTYAEEADDAANKDSTLI